eukprot:scaffold8348_cov19-Prasinocladus_malaysianus.AAC.1
MCCCWDLSGYAQEEGGALAIFRGGLAIMKHCKFEHNFAALDGIQVSQTTTQLCAGPVVTASQGRRQSLHIFRGGFMQLRRIVLKVGRSAHRATRHQPITLYAPKVFQQFVVRIVGNTLALCECVSQSGSQSSSYWAFMSETLEPSENIGSIPIHGSMAQCRCV